MPRTPRHLSGLQAFEAAARLRSVTRAAAELGVTPGAVSQRLRALEDHLGRALMLREGRGVRPTLAGEHLLPGLTRGFSDISGALASLARDDSVVTVSALPSFATRWLLRRLEDFYALFPEIEIRVDASMQCRDMISGDIDVAVRYCHPGCAPESARHLLDDILYPVVSPRLLPTETTLTCHDLAHYALIEQDWDGRPTDWPVWDDWCAVAGIEPFSPRNRRQFNIFAHAVQAALAGQGFLLAHHALVADDVAAGVLSRPFSAFVASPYAFHLLLGKHRTAAQRKFVDWLVNQCRADTSL